MGKRICPAQRQSQIPAGFIAFGLEPALCGQGRLDVEECEGCVKGVSMFSGGHLTVLYGQET